MPRIGELLIKNGIISDKQLREALRYQDRKKKKKLGEILIELGYLNTKDLIWILSEQADIPFVEVRPEMLDSELINTFPENVLQDNNVLPLYETDEKIFIAVGDPTNEDAIKKMKKFTTKELVASGTDPEKISQLLNKFFLAQQTEEVIKPEHEGKTVIRFTDKEAIIEFIDPSGKTRKKKGSVKIVVNIQKEKGET